VEGTVLQKNEVDVIDVNQQWKEVTYGNKCKQFVRKTREKRLAKRKLRAISFLKLKIEEKAALKVRKKCPRKTQERETKSLLLQTQRM